MIVRWAEVADVSTELDARISEFMDDAVEATVEEDNRDLRYSDDILASVSDRAATARSVRIEAMAFKCVCCDAEIAT